METFQSPGVELTLASHNQSQFGICKAETTVVKWQKETWGRKLSSCAAAGKTWKRKKDFHTNPGSSWAKKGEWIVFYLPKILPILETVVGFKEKEAMKKERWYGESYYRRLRNVGKAAGFCQTSPGLVLAPQLTSCETLHVQPLEQGLVKRLEENKTGGRKVCGRDHQWVSTLILPFFRHKLGLHFSASLAARYGHVIVFMQTGCEPLAGLACKRFPYMLSILSSLFNWLETQCPWSPWRPHAKHRQVSISQSLWKTVSGRAAPPIL